MEQSSYSAMLHIPGISSAPGINSINSRNSGIGSNLTSTDSGIDSTNSRNSGIVSTTNSVRFRNSVQFRNYNILDKLLGITPHHSIQFRYGIPGIESRRNW